MRRAWSSELLGGSSELAGGDAGPSPSGRRLRPADFLDAPLNHPWLAVLPFLVTVAVATTAAFVLPERYTTSCLVLVKFSQVPDKILTHVSEELDARRHQTIRQEILSRTRLEKVNDELRPYPAARSVAAALESMREALDVNFKGSDAFTIEFTHRDPLMAMNLTNRVASLFIEEFRRSRRTQFEGAADFLDAELQGARQELDAKEEAVRRYKERNMGRLPEQMQATLSTLHRLQLELQGIDQNLEAAEARLERLTARGGPGSVTAAPETGLSEKDSLELELARLRQRYTDEHPDVQEMRARLRRVEEQPPAPPTGDARNAISSTQVERAQAEVAALLSRRTNLQAELASQQARVEQMPRTEQELATLTRDFNQLRDNYQELLRKRMDAQMAERLQLRWTEDFEILDQARQPEHHAFPNRLLLILGGAFAGLCFGFGAALLAELFSPYVLSLEDLEATLPLPVLAVLPIVDAKKAAAAPSLISRRTGKGGPPSTALHH